MRVLVDLLIFSFTILTFKTEAYRILGIFPFHSRSHQMMYDAISKGLARRGHQIDVMTVHPLKEPIANYTVIVNLENVQKSLVNQWDFDYASKLTDDIIPLIALSFGNDVCEYLALPTVQRIIRNPPIDPPYDLIITESLGANCFIGLGYALDIPVVLATSLVDSPWLDQSLGQPRDITAYFGAYFTGYTHPMTFFERLHNTVVDCLNLIRFRQYTDNVQNDLMKKYIDPNIPSLRELEKNVALALVNSYHSLHGVRPLVPNLIEVGGLHVYEHYEEMSFELKKWMNESTAGVVYFTLGSMVNIETLPENVLRAFYSVFNKIAPVRVLMKIAQKEKLLSGPPENVKVLPWIPQIAVLAHNNTKAFMTHGGLMSTQEALTFGVPMIGIPLFADQFSNIDLYVKKNIAVKLNYRNLAEDEIHNAINRVLNDPQYQKLAKYESARFLDRPLSAMDTTIFWIEYAIRHGSKVLRSPVVDMPWWQSALVDVYISIVVLTLTKIYIVYRILRKYLYDSSLPISKKTKNLHYE